jgi:hypothetical protein
MPSASLGIWQNDRLPRLAGIDAQCAAAVADEAGKNAASIAAAAAAGVPGAAPAVIAAPSRIITYRGFSARIRGSVTKGWLVMVTESVLPSFKVGDLVSILNSGYKRVRIAEDRGPLGPAESGFTESAFRRSLGPHTSRSARIRWRRSTSNRSRVRRLSSGGDRNVLLPPSFSSPPQEASLAVRFW